MAARPFDTDAPYITHPRSGAVFYEPIPADTLHALADIRTLQRHTQDAALLNWLIEREAMLVAHCADCPPVVVRNVEERKRDRPPRKEPKYVMYGVRGRSGKARG
jgi:hypothetical protein